MLYNDKAVEEQMQFKAVGISLHNLFVDNEA